MKISANSFSECGPYRKENEDTIYVNTEKGLFVVADGLGGLAEGRYASSQATEIFVNEFLDSDNPTESIQPKLRRSLSTTNRILFAESRARSVKFGTTFTAAHIDNATLNFIHIGDTALWLFSESERSFEVLTRQDTLESEYLNKGSPPILASQYRNVLTQAVGLEEVIVPQVGSAELKPQDLLILCSDGFFNCVDSSEIINLRERTSDIDQLTQTLKQLLIGRMPRDNFSAILLSLA